MLRWLAHFAVIVSLWSLEVDQVVEYLFYSTAGQAFSENSVEPDGGQLSLAVSMVWEGESLNAGNLAAVRAFRDTFAQIPLIHFLSPAYWLAPGADRAAVLSAIRSVIRPQDAVGLYIAPWKSIVIPAGLAFRNQPTFWGNRLSSRECEKDCGRDVALTSYPPSDLHTLIDFSLNELARAGFSRPQFAMASGWLASPSVLEAEIASGIKQDFSAVALNFVEPRLRVYPVASWLRSLWPSVTALTQPYIIRTPVGTILEFTNNGATVDYASPTDLMNLAGSLLNTLEEHPTQTLYLHFGFFQESATQYLPRLAKTLRQVFKQAEASRVKLTFYGPSGPVPDTSGHR